MNMLRRLLLASASIALVLTSAVGVASATLSGPYTASMGSISPATDLSLTFRPGAASTPGALALTGLEAVLIVGPEPENPGYSSFANAIMDDSAEVLAANGVTVHKFYSPNADWTHIKQAAASAQFFLYAGHGVFWTGGPTPQVGGLHLDGGNVSSDTIRNELRLAPRAIVMLAACYTAGTGSFEARSVDIGIQEAQRRVAEYSDPFLDIGANGYYGNSFGWNNALDSYLRLLFQGKTMGEAYKSMGDFNSSTVTYGTHPSYPAMALWVDKDFDQAWIYNESFVGYPDRGLQDLFGNRLSVDPSSQAFLASFGSTPQYRTLHIDLPQNVGWTATFTPSTPSWASASPQSGTGPSNITVQAKPASVSALGTYQAGLQIVANDPGIEDGRQTVPITLRVVDHLDSVFVPLVSR